MMQMNLEDISIDEILSRCGHTPVYQKGSSTWYLSPFREETKPSFQVRGSVFTDWGNPDYKGGVLTLCSLLFDIPRENTKEIFMKLQEIFNGVPLGVQTRKDASSATLEKEREKVVATYPLNNPLLLDYLNSRGVLPSVAQKFTRVVVYLDPTRTKKLYGIGFGNRSGGCELRSKYAKRSFAPKDISILNGGNPSDKGCAVVFEGFIDALSYISDRVRKGQSLNFTSVVLNGVGMVDKAIDELKDYKWVYGLLDNDRAGDLATSHLATLPNFVDSRDWLGKFKDVNEKIMSDLNLSEQKMVRKEVSQQNGRKI